MGCIMSVGQIGHTCVLTLPSPVHFKTPYVDIQTDDTVGKWGGGPG